MPVELGVIVGRNGCDIAATQAMDHVGGYGMGATWEASNALQRSR